ncbi:MAG: hypothetical protein PHH37_10580 [Paludibacter sp.]|nr:hypothetical protein [Paludibacter sp.]
MKKQLLFFRILLITGLLFSLNNVNATQVPNYIVDETFGDALPTGWSVENDANYELFGSDGWYNLNTPTGKLNLTTANKKKNMGLKITFPSSGTETEVYLEFDWTITSAKITNLQSYALFFRDNVATPKTTSGDIMILYLSGDDGMIHCQNIDNSNPAYIDTDSWNGMFLKSGADNATCNTNNASTITTCGWAFGQTIHIKASFNFSTHKVTYLQLSNTTTGSSSYENTAGLDFLSTSAANISKICFTQTKENPTAAGTYCPSNTSIDNFQLYTLQEVSGTANVTVNYFEPDGNTPAKTARIEADQPVDIAYTATSDDKASFTSGGYYYAFDADATTSDNVVVTADGLAHVDLIFKKTAVTAGTYKWTGATNALWSETDNNFTTDDINSLAYQTGNAVELSSTGTNKTITIGSDVDLGSNNLNITGDAYELTGPGSINGTGAVTINVGETEITTLGVTNNLTGGVTLNNGTLIISKDDAVTALTAASGTTVDVNTGVAFSKAIIGAVGSFTIKPTSNVTYTSAITVADSVNYLLQSEGSASSSGTFSGLPVMNNSFNGKIKVATASSTFSLFGSTNSYVSNKLELNGMVYMVYPVNPASDGSTTIGIGELKGNSDAKIMGPRLRTVTYNIGALNTDATFAGTIENFPADAWSNIPVINTVKSGTGVLTLSGNSAAYVAGAVSVNEGELNITGTLGTSTIPVNVAADGILNGTGTIPGATVVNGSLKGRLNFGSDLTLNGTTNIVVDGFSTGEFDAINVTGAVNNGGTLDVTVNASNPESGTTIQLINAGTFNGTFTTLNLPANYTFNALTGELTYTVATNIDEQTSGLTVYADRESINIKGICAGENYRVYDAMGKMLVNENANSGNVRIALSNSGVFIVKITNDIIKIVK